MVLICLRCHAICRDEHEDAVVGCENCGEAVFVRTRHPAALQRIVASASVAQKEQLFEALDDVLGEDADQDGAVIVDLETLEHDEDAWKARILHRTAAGPVRMLSLEEEPALGFLALH